MTSTTSPQTPERKEIYASGTVFVGRPTPAHLPFGARGELPCYWLADRRKVDRIADLEMPGVLIYGSRIECTWDVVPIIAHHLGERAPSPPQTSSINFPGLQRYKELGLSMRRRGYQGLSVSFLATHAYGFLADDARTGKTPTCIMAAELCGAKKVLVITPGSVKPVWAHHISDWAKEESVILHGRGADELRVFCRTCDGHGRIREEAVFEPCPDCKARNGQSLGERIYRIEELRPSYDITEVDGVSRAAWPPAYWTCPIHEEVRAPQKGRCSLCRDLMLSQIASHRYIIANPDLLIAQRDKTLPGVEYVRSELPGWVPTLTRFPFTWAFCDEAHRYMRAWRGKAEGDDRLSKREQIIKLTENFERVFSVTATPMVGFIRDYWPQLDLVSKGLWGSKKAPRLPWSFAQAFCQGGKDSDTGFWGWDGTGPRAESELKPRLRHLKIQRSIEECAPDMPPVTRQVIRVEPEDQVIIKTKEKKGDSAYKKMLRRAGDVKRVTVIDAVIDEMACGHKVIVFANLNESVEGFTSDLQKAMGKREWSACMKARNAKVWAGHGGWVKGKGEDDKDLKGGANADVRYQAGKLFSSHKGAGCFVAGIDAYHFGISMLGAVTIHFLEYHNDPGIMFQAERRPREVGSLPLTIVYWIAVGTIDERFEDRLLPKIAAMDKMQAAGPGTKQTLKAFGAYEDEDSSPLDVDKLIVEMTALHD